MFYSKTTKGFYDEDIHGLRKLQVPDPAWVRPNIDVILQPGESYYLDGVAVATNNGTEAATFNVPDASAQPNIIEIDNPASKIPADAVAVSKEIYDALMTAQAQGKMIVPDADGNPVAVDRPATSFDVLIDPYLTKVRKAREVVLNRIIGIAWAANKDGDHSMDDAIAQARIDLLNFTIDPSVVAAQAAKDFAAYESAVQARWAAIATAAPAALRTAFLKVDE
jgi:hypothetical protein